MAFWKLGNIQAFQGRVKHHTQYCIASQKRQQQRSLEKKKTMKKEKRTTSSRNQSTTRVGQLQSCTYVSLNHNALDKPFGQSHTFPDAIQLQGLSGSFRQRGFPESIQLQDFKNFDFNTRLCRHIRPPVFPTRNDLTSLYFYHSGES